MTKVRLEIDGVKIHRERKTWKLYFVIVAEHPKEPDKMIVTSLPDPYFKLSSRHENEYYFDTEEEGSEGLFVLSRELPDDAELNVHIYLRHTRNSTRDIGVLLQDIESGIAGETFGIIKDIPGFGTTPWLVIAKKAVPLIGKVLEKIPDKDFGFLSAFERFGDEFNEQTDIDRKKDFTGDASIIYSWSLDK